MKRLMTLNNANIAIFMGVLVSFFSFLLKGALFPLTKIFAPSIILPAFIIAVPHVQWFSIIGATIALKNSLFFGMNILNLFYPATMLGSLFMRYSHENVYTRILFSLLIITCFLSFVTHPVGSHASLYTIFWLIPLSFLISNGTSLLLRTLATVFISHAIGTVIYLYSHITIPAYWIALMPQVLVERLLMVSSIMLMGIIVSMVVSALKKISLQKTFFTSNFSKNI